METEMPRAWPTVIAEILDLVKHSAGQSRVRVRRKDCSEPPFLPWSGRRPLSGDAGGAYGQNEQAQAYGRGFGRNLDEARGAVK
ncbi:hypothetical protein GCM10017667_06900 [Streptomyces filamentosus]|uniref:Uncharacterized protein n=1 Tax=Streptomyces filamentosus TaxID=67294 RepID=A0A919EHX4_STRFL|nr:hypothetical protein GCM10017667_06900 [Streptomyces filamentosus]